MTKRSSPAGSGRGRRRVSERRVQSRSTPSEAKPGSLWPCGSYRSWDLYTTGQLVDGLQQKRKPVFIKRKWNHVFSRATILSFHPVFYF